jgi:excisionase family DNA binding protein
VSTAEQQSSRLLSLPQAAERLGCSVGTLRRRIRAGDLAAVRLGPSDRHPLRIDERALEDWVFGDPREKASA